MKSVSSSHRQGGVRSFFSARFLENGKGACLLKSASTFSELACLRKSTSTFSEGSLSTRSFFFEKEELVGFWQPIPLWKILSDERPSDPCATTENVLDDSPSTAVRTAVGCSRPL